MSAARFGIPVMTAEDVFSVERLVAPAGLTFHVAHFRSRGARTVFCDATITRAAGESDGDALHRAARAIDANHGRT